MKDKNPKFVGIADKGSLLRLGTWNIGADYYDHRYKEKNQHNYWQERKKYVKQIVKGLDFDVLCLQEFSTKQAKEFQEFSQENGYNFYSIVQTPSDIESGSIAINDQVDTWCGKNTGTGLLGFMIKTDWKVSQVDSFYLKEDPDTPPSQDIKDRGQTDKGFGNMNTFRLVFHAELKLTETDSLDIYNSALPLSGGNKARMGCTKVLNRKIAMKSSDSYYVSAGDMKIVPHPTDDKSFNPQNLYDNLTQKGSSDAIKKSDNHIGIYQTWMGYNDGRFTNKLNEDSFKTTPESSPFSMDVITTNVSKVPQTFGYHGAVDSEGLLVPCDKLPPQNAIEECHYASDHALLGADLDLGLTEG